VYQVLNTQPRTYRIKDLNGEEIVGSFYAPEMQTTNQDVYRVEKVIRTRTKNGQKEAYVKWLGYPPSFISWIKHDDLL